MRAVLLMTTADLDRFPAVVAAEPDLLLVDAEDQPGFRPLIGIMREAASRAPLFVRVARLSQGGDEQLARIMPAAPSGIWLRNTHGIRDVEQLASRLAVFEAELGLHDGSTRIVASVDSACASLAVASLRERSPRLAGLTYDLEALSAEIGCRRAAGRQLAEPLRLVRASVALVAAAAGVPAIDAAPPPDTGADALAAEAEQAGRDGFSAKLALSPDQVALLRRVPPQAPLGRWMENFVSGVATK